jgi:rRNA maturation protein Nop10
LEGQFYPTATYLWQGPNGFLSTSRQLSINAALPVNSGLYTLTVSQQVCGTSVVSIPVLVGGTVRVSPLGSNSPVCVGNALIMSAPAVQNGSVLWLGPSGFTSNSSTFSIPNMQLAQAGEYTVISTSPGCGTLSNTRSVLVNQPPILAIDSNSPVCQGNVIILSVPIVSGVTYAWNGPNGFQSVGNYVAISNASLANIGVYTLTSTQPGCGTTSTSVSVHVGSNIVGISPSSNSPVCLNGSLQLSAENRPNVDYLWQSPDGFTSNLSTFTRNNMTALQAPSGSGVAPEARQAAV